MEKNISYFNMDDYRAGLLRNGDLKKWVGTYSDKYPSLEESSNDVKWDMHAGLSKTSENPYTIQRINQIASLIKKRNQGVVLSILDFGVGYGDVVEKVKDRDINYLGIDISEKFIENLSARYGEYDNLNFKKIDIFDFHEKAPNMILALEVLEHIEPKNLFNILTRFHQLLPTGGSLVVSVPLFEDLQAITNYCSKCGHMENPNSHVRSYSPELLKAELEHAKFRVLDEDYVWHSVGLKSKIISVFRRLIGRETRVNMLVVAEKI